VAARFHSCDDSDGSSDSVTTIRPDHAHGHLTVSQLGFIDVAVHFDRGINQKHPMVKVKEEKILPTQAWPLQEM